MSHSWTHPWCKSPARDEAVRAAEDNRTGPLPTLDECIERQTARPCGGADPAPLGGEPGGAVNGLRTERVTLEVTHHCRFPLAEWLLDMVAEFTSDPGESVRVVEESAPAASGAAGPEPVAWMCEWTDYMSFYESRTQAERSVQGDVVVPQPLYRTPPQTASGAAGPEPDAWGVRRNGRVDCVTHRLFRSMAERSAEQFGGTVVPLYAAPQAAKGWLTPEERRTLSETADVLEDRKAHAYADFVRALLARSSPPEVVRPRQPSCPWGRDRRSWDDACLAMQREYDSALAAAGVTVKEVGK